MVGGPELFSKWLGESEEAVRHVFKLARELAPCVMFFDQLDAVAPVRGRSSGTWTTERVVHQLLAEIDDLGRDTPIAVIAATNRIDLIDESLLQPGRLGTHIELTLPDAAGRAAILKLFLGERLDNVAQLLHLARITEGWSGSRLHALSRTLEREGKLPRNEAAWQTFIQRIGAPILKTERE